jgi:acetyl-CoA acetyltransferase
MKGVSVIGVGMIPFGKYPDKNIADLGWPAVKAALKDAGIEGKRIQAVYSGTARGGAMVGQRIMGRIGLAGIPIVNVENACSSSSGALAQGVIAVGVGAYDVVLVIGVEKLTKFGGGTLPSTKTIGRCGSVSPCPRSTPCGHSAICTTTVSNPSRSPASRSRIARTARSIPTRRCGKR